MAASAAGLPEINPFVMAGWTTCRAIRSVVWAASVTDSRSATRRLANAPATATPITTARAPAMTWISTVRGRSGRSGGVRASVRPSRSHGTRAGTPG